MLYALYSHFFLFWVLMFYKFYNSHGEVCCRGIPPMAPSPNDHPNNDDTHVSMTNPYTMYDQTFLMDEYTCPHNSHPKWNDPNAQSPISYHLLYSNHVSPYPPAISHCAQSVLEYLSTAMKMLLPF